MSVARKPETLASIAGLPSLPAAPDRSMLVMIDPQLEYTVGRLPLADIDAAVEEGARLVEFARSRGMPVFHVVHHSRPGAPVFDPRGPHVGFIPALAPLPGERVIVKGLPNAFAGTVLMAALDETMATTGRRELVIAGFATHMCVSATARAALDHGFRPTLVANATATRDLPHPLGAGVVKAAAVQAAALAALSDRFSVVVPDTAALSVPGPGRDP